MIITFCGHSDFIPNVQTEKSVMSLLIGQASLNEKVYCYSGGYGAFDLFAANCIDKVKQLLPKIINCIVVPYITSSHNKRIEAYKSMFDEIIYPPLENVPLKYAIIRRNEWMVNNCDMLVAYVKYNFGGAARMLNYAKNKSVKIVLLE